MRSKDRELMPAYEAIDRFVEVALKGSDSVFTPGRRIWTRENLDALHKEFVQQPEVGKDAFDVKFQRQLEKANAATIQLAAEVVFVQLIPPSNMGAAKKVALVEKVLGWSRERVAMPDRMKEALRRGVTSDMSFLLHRPFHLQYLIEFMRRWKAEPPDRSHRLLGDPWAFRDMAHEVEVKYAPSMGRILCWFVHPDYFETVTSEGMRRRILRGFADRVGDTGEDPDRSLHELRGRLAKEYGPDFNYYDDKVRKVWDSATKSAAAGSDAATFFKWCARVLATEGFEENEVAYKRRIAARTNEARSALLGGKPEWADLLKASVKHRENNLLMWRVVNKLAAWCTGDREAAATVLRLLWREGSIHDRLAAFEAAMPASVTKPPGVRASVHSFLLMAEDVEKWPIFRPTVLAQGYELSGYSRPAPRGGAVERYRFACEFLDWMVDEAGRFEVDIPDRLHAQSILFAFAKWKKAPSDWTRDDWKRFDEFRGGARDDDMDGTGTEDDGGEEPRRDGPAAATSLNRIYYGPPGTGKTYRALRDAIALCDGVEPEGEDVSSHLRRLSEAGRLRIVTFHQSFSYEDFVEGIRPEIDEATRQLRYATRDGVLKDMARRAEQSRISPAGGHSPVDLPNARYWKVSLGRAGSDSGREIYADCIRNGRIRMGYGWDLDFSECEDREAVTARIRERKPEYDSGTFDVRVVHDFRNEMSAGDIVLVPDGLAGIRAIGRVTGDYVWLGKELGTNYVQARPVEWLKTFDETLPWNRLLRKKLSQATLYELGTVDLTELASILAGDASAGTGQVPAADPPHVLVIDEINRANVSKVLGELITLLEADKRLGAPNEVRSTLPYSGERFGLPPNLYIVGTMNTADRSLAFLDIALRRRFDFVEFAPDSDLIRDRVGEVEGVDVGELLAVLNDRIEVLLDRDHALGHSYFLGVKSLRDLHGVFRSRIFALLQEYFRGDDGRIARVLGCPFDDDGRTPNRAPILVPRVLASMIGGAGADDAGERRVTVRMDPALDAADDERLREVFLAMSGREAE